MIGETFAHGKSLLHRLDPRGKLLAAALLVFPLAFCHRAGTILSALALALCLVLLARLPGREVARRLLFANIFLLFFWLLLPFTYGEQTSSLGPLPINGEGLLFAARLTVKTNAIVMVFMALVATSSIVTLGHALHSLSVPAKLVYLLLFTFRYIHVMETEYRKLHNAMLIRGFRPQTDMHTYRSYAYLIGMLLVRSSNRAQRVSEAMLCRGFHGRFHSLYRFSLTRTDVLFGVLVLLAVTMLVYLEWLKWI
jgi:cobalt/nickel transport system permease protein